MSISVSELKQRLGVDAGVRLVIEADSTVPLVEHLPSSAPAVEQAPPPPPPQVSSMTNNAFMKKNIRVREWGSFSTSETPIRKLSLEDIVREAHGHGGQETGVSEAEKESPATPESL